MIMQTMLLSSVLAVAYSHDGGMFMQLPTQPDTWVVVDDTGGTCELARQDGDRIVEASGRELLLSSWGVYYSRQGADEPWRATGRGSWLTDVWPNVGWSRQVIDETSPTYPHLHRLYWQGSTHVFVNDPRYGENNYRPDERYGRAWLAVELGRGCRVYREASRAYAEPGLQTIQIGEDWTVSTGRARGEGRELVGDWLRE